MLLATYVGRALAGLQEVVPVVVQQTVRMQEELLNVEIVFRKLMVLQICVRRLEHRWISIFSRVLVITAVICLI